MGCAGCLLPSYEEDAPTECSQGQESWGSSYSGTKEESVLDLATDGGKNLIAVGTYDGETRLGEKKFTNEDESINGFVMKLGPSGEFQWADSMSNENAVVASLVDTAPDGRILVGGTFFGTIELGGAPKTQAGSAGQNIFIVEYGPTGAPIWNEGLAPNEIDKSPSSPLINELSLYDLRYDRQNDIVVCGTFHLELDAGQNKTHLFLLKIGSDLNLKWIQRFDTPALSLTDGHVEPAAIGFDSSNNIYISGAYGGGTLQFSDTIILPSSDSERLFFAKLDASGVPIKAEAYDLSTETDQRASDMIIDSEDNKYVLASNFGTLSLDGPDKPGDPVDPSGTITIESQAYEDLVIIKQDANDKVLWARGFGGTGEDRGEKLALLGSGKLVVTGTTSADIFFEKNLISSGNKDIFLAFLKTSNGSPTFSLVFGDSAEQNASGLVIGRDAKPYIAGDFGGTLDFGLKPLVKSSGPKDLFIAKPCQ